MKQITEEKFKAIQVLAEDFASTGSRVYYYRGKLNFEIFITATKKTVKFVMSNCNVLPIKTMTITYDIETFKKMPYEQARNVINEMGRSVTT